MSDHPPVSAPSAGESHRGLRALALVAVIIGVLALAAAAFLLSYSGIHAIARTAGVSPRLARLYPLILDAMLVIACAAVLFLRGARLLARCYAWLSMLVLLAAAAGADALHATGTRLPHRPAAAAVAIIPWVLVLIGFGLLLTMLRYARQRLIAAHQAPVAAPVSQGEQLLGIHDLFTPKASGPGPAVRPAPRPAELPAPAVVAAPASTAAPAGPAAPGTTAAADTTVLADPTVLADTTAAAGGGGGGGGAGGAGGADADHYADHGADHYADHGADHYADHGADHYADHGADHGADLAIDSEPEQDDPTSDEASLASPSAAAWVPQARAELPAEDEMTYSGGFPAAGLSPAPTIDYVADPDADGAIDPARVEPAGDVAEDQAADDDATLAQPEPAALPPFLRKRSSPTPPED